MMDSLRSASVATLVAAVLLQGCYSYHSIQGRDLDGPMNERPAVVRIRVWDSARLTLASPRLNHRSIAGTVIDCEGRACAEYQGAVRVPYANVSGYEARTSRAAQNAAIVLVTALGAAGLFGIGYLVISALSFQWPSDWSGFAGGR